MKPMAGLVLVCMAVASLGGASAPTSRPARPAAPIELSPLGWLRVYNEAMLNGDKDDLMSRSYSSNEDARRLAAAITAHDALVGQILKLAQAKFDDKAATLIGRSLGDIGNDELSNATLAIDGERAIVRTRGGLGETHLILHNGQWKLDFDRSLAQRVQMGETIEEILASLTPKTTTAEALRKGLESGSIKTLDDALFLVRRNQWR